jgi:hypothetical protein
VRRGTDIHSNTVEGVFSLIRRGMMARSTAKAESTFQTANFSSVGTLERWNDAQRVSAAIKTINGKRLEYRESIDNPPYMPKPTGGSTVPRMSRSNPCGVGTQ